MSWEELTRLRDLVTDLQDVIKDPQSTEEEKNKAAEEISKKTDGLDEVVKLVVMRPRPFRDPTALRPQFDEETRSLLRRFRELCAPAP